MAKWDYYSFLFKYLGLIAFKKKTIGKTAEAMAALHGDKPFLLFENEQHSFKAFNANANRRANFLRAQGIGKGDVVALMMENRPEYAETLVAVGKLGAITSAINTNLRAQALQHTIDTALAKKIIVGAECLAALKDVLPSLGHLSGADVYIDTRWPGDSQPPEGSQDLNPLLAQASPDNPPHPPLNSLDLLMYIYTSGTTGLPKAARINHFRWYAAGLAMGTYALRVRPQDTVYCPLPLYHSNGGMIAFGSALVNGARLALSRGFSASGFWEEAARHKATSMIYIGEVLRYLVNTPPGPFDRKHQVTRILGNGLRPDIWATFQQRFGVDTIREFYASTEGNAVTINMDNVLGSMGKAVLKSSDNTALVKFDPQREDYVRSDSGYLQHCAPGEVGELLGQIKATAPFHGYTSAKDTEKKILRNAFKQGDAFFRTGDLVKKDEQGFYYFVDRIGDTFRWKGENVSTQEVQEIVSRFGGVSLVNVVGVEVPNTEGRAGLAAITMDADGRFDPQAFYGYVAEKLPAYARPAFVRLISEMELTGTFKMKKTDLKAQGYDPSMISEPVYYRDDAAGTYAPLDTVKAKAIDAGSIRF